MMSSAPQRQDARQQQLERRIPFDIRHVRQAPTKMMKAEPFDWPISELARCTI